MPKTGTTSIQNALHAVRSQLLKSDKLLYPGVAENHTNAICTMFMSDPKRHISNRMAGISKDSDIENLKNKYRSSIEKEMRANSWDTLLISAEGISNLSKPEISGFRDWALSYADKVSVLFWVREPVAYTVSVIQQIIKGGVLLNQLYKNPPIPNWRGKISNSIAVFGFDNVTVRDFETAQTHSSGIVGAFAEHVGLSDESKLIVSAAAEFDNESMSIEAVQLFDQLNRMTPMFINGQRNPERFNGELAIFQKIKGEKFDVPFEVKRRCYNLTRPDVNWLNKTFGLQLYDDPPIINNNVENMNTNWSPRAIVHSAKLLHNLSKRVTVLQYIIDAQNFLVNGNSKASKNLVERAVELDPDVFLPEKLDKLVARKQPG